MKKENKSLIVQRQSVKYPVLVLMSRLTRYRGCVNIVILYYTAVYSVLVYWCTTVYYSILKLDKWEVYWTDMWTMP